MEQKPDKVEVIDFFGEEFNKRTIPCSVGFIIITLVALINLIVMVLYPGTYYSILISLVIVIGFVLYYSYIIAKNPGKIRKFSISTDYIEFLLPDSPLFRITWADFVKLEIIKKEFSYNPYCRYEFHFINDESDKSVKLSFLDFQKVNLDKILKLMKDFARLMKKEFAAVKETNVSGVILLENFKI